MTTDLNQNREKVNTRLEITSEMKGYLLKATKWIYFLNLLSCIGCVLSVLSGIFILFSGIEESSQRDLFKGVWYLIVIAIWYPPLKRTFTFVEQARSACMSDDNVKLAGMFDSLRFVAKYYGIIAIVLIAIFSAILVLRLVLAAILGTSLI